MLNSLRIVCKKKIYFAVNLLFKAVALVFGQWNFGPILPQSIEGIQSRINQVFFYISTFFTVLMMLFVPEICFAGSKFDLSAGVEVGSFLDFNLKKKEVNYAE